MEAVNRPTRRRTAELHGRAAEESVAANWQANGYDILARRLRTGSGEIDLVVANASHLVFVEVKARKSVSEAAYAVLPRQQSRLLEAANTVLAAREDWHRPFIRFDVALVCGSRIEHIEDAIRYN
jgi:putative endonuclease